MTDIIIDAINKLEVKVDENQLVALNNYAAMLIKWNKVYSLTAISSLRQIKILHLIDGLSLIPHLPDNGLVLDVGSGMGVPGIIIAIMKPDLQVTLIDSSSKKIAFLRQVKIELGLVNLEIINSRVEKYDSQKFDIITSRAFADLSLFISLTEHLLNDSGYYLAMKSQQASNEVDKLNNYSSDIINLQVPYLDAPRVLVKIRKL